MDDFTIVLLGIFLSGAIGVYVGMAIEGSRQSALEVDYEPAFQASLIVFDVTAIQAKLKLRKSDVSENSNTSSAAAGFGLGTLIAVALSWGANHSILWAIVHGVVGWFYVIY